ncbi:MAG TPA: pyridoxamine 5'-phosphate oxidase family protein [Intrasporangium sp.]|uniref:pyridoxamine 5'-phosphate oxidase family protein n=1 Tax=Intrasporangium sp. TaxID=1925024 RepID=UPI002D799409|nr:pyridoxamine 5'-phosphate oxidase family protein [Intrasporangium sp.]HET7398606.1 pyridoxamine 5'-phosphate oxidase family protein [Intrasporangium sp.]
METSISECWALLRTATVGRLAVLVDGEPDIFPVNFAVDHGSVVFRTDAGTKLSASIGQVVAFEADGYDADTREAWSVVAKGKAVEIQQMYDVLDAMMLPLFPWQPGPKSHYVRIDPTSVTGRRFTAART